MTNSQRPTTADGAEAGLCETCRHSRVVHNDRGATFLYCDRSRFDERFPKYPRLPVVVCAGWEEHER